MSLEKCRRRFWRPFVGAILFCAVAISARATTVVPPDFATLVREADYVVRAKVRSVESSWQETQRGRLIVSKVSLEVVEVVVGSPPAEVVLEVLGGKVGEDEMSLEGVPRFTLGDEAIYFVQGNGRQIYPLVRMMHGRYPVQRDPASGREYIARSNGVPMEQTAEVALPMLDGAAATLQRRMKPAGRALSPGDFTREIRARHKEQLTQHAIER